MAGPAPLPVVPEPTPVEYAEPAAEVVDEAPSVVPAAGGSTRDGWQTPSAEERARIERDPVVKQTLDLFDGALIGFKAAPTTPPDEETE